MHKIKNPSDRQSGRGEFLLEGTAVSRGVAVGAAIRLFGDKRQYVRKTISQPDVAAELSRFTTSVATARYQLLKLLRSQKELPASAHGILEVHLLMIEQSPLIKDVEGTIEDERVNAEWALSTVTGRYIERQNAVQDENLRERAGDIDDVSERILNALGEGSELPLELLDGSVIFASTIRPSTLVELSRRRPIAIVTEHGGWTSHAFIMAREMRIPAVTGIKDVLHQVDDGAETAVDGYNGQVIIRPSGETVKRVSGIGSSVVNPEARTIVTSSVIRTLDRREIIIRANADSEQSVECLHSSGALGVGLLRSEYLFAHANGTIAPEEEQISAYEKIIAAAAPNGVRIRTFDLNAEHLSPKTGDQESNPSLGLRAIRLSLAYETHFRSQIRAILRSAHNGNVEILLPMVCGVDEIQRSRELIDREKAALRRDGLPCGDPGIGAMIEVPSAVVMIDEILQNVDFVCLGTNDLVQYLLAVDRDNESVAEFYQTLHPAVTRSIRIVLAAAERENIPAAICGEMAGSPFYAPLLIGYGAREFSMSVDSIPRIRTVIEGISFDEARSLAREIDTAANAKEAENLIRVCYNHKWPHLFPDDFLDLAAEKSFQLSSKN